MTNPTGAEMAATAVDQGRDGGDQHPGDEVLADDHPEVAAVLEGLTQDDSQLKDA